MGPGRIQPISRELWRRPNGWWVAIELEPAVADQDHLVDHQDARQGPEQRRLARAVSAQDAGGDPLYRLPYFFGLFVLGIWSVNKMRPAVELKVAVELTATPPKMVPCSSGLRASHGGNYSARARLEAAGAGQRLAVGGRYVAETTDNGIVL